MEKIYKAISVVLHPVVVPTISVLLYFILIPNNYASKLKLTLLGLIFITTYFIPILILVLFKNLKLITSYNTHSIQERKVPVAIMIVLFYLLGLTIAELAFMFDLSLLFYATSAALTCIYIFFAFGFKTSLHLVSLGISIGFFILLGFAYNYSFHFTVITFILLAGLVANARLYLKAHTPKEVYVGFFLGLVAPFLVFYLL